MTLSLLLNSNAPHCFLRECRISMGLWPGCPFPVYSISLMSLDISTLPRSQLAERPCTPPPRVNRLGGNAVVAAGSKRLSSSNPDRSCFKKHTISSFSARRSTRHNEPPSSSRCSSISITSLGFSLTAATVLHQINLFLRRAGPPHLTYPLEENGPSQHGIQDGDAEGDGVGGDPLIDVRPRLRLRMTPIELGEENDTPLRVSHFGVAVVTESPRA